MRLGALFVAVCMTVIAASAGAVVYFAYGFTGADAIIVAIAALTALAIYNAVSTRLNVRSVVGPQLSELSRSGGDLARQLAEMGRRLAAVETKLERTLAKGEATIEPLAVEISELGALVDQLAETVSIHETQLIEIERSEQERSKAERSKSEQSKSEQSNSERFKLERFGPEPVRPAPAKPDWFSSPPAVAPAAAAAVAPATPVAVEPAPPPPAPAPVPPATVVTMPAAVSAAPTVSVPDATVPTLAAATLAAAPIPAAPIPAVPIPVAPILAAPPAPILAAPVVPVAAPSPPVDKSVAREMLAAIRSAIQANRIDLHLQPIVTLPQRKVRFYEAMSRLRTESGDVVLAAEFISQAEAGGLMPKIDNLVVFRCVQVLRRLLLKNREVGIFCNLSVATLTDAVVFPQLLDFLDANRAIAPSLVLEFTQGGLRGAGPIETESLAALKACGFHFSMDNVTDLRLEPRELASRGFRFVKLRANLILNRSGITADIHPGDLPDLLARFGIDLIAEKIESEGSVVDLLDYDVKFGQGFLFSPPRPVRAEALQGVADRNDVVASESAVPNQGTAARGLAPTGLAPTGLAPRGPAPRSPGAEVKDARAPTPEASNGLRSAGLTRLARRV